MTPADPASWHRPRLLAGPGGRTNIQSTASSKGCKGKGNGAMATARTTSKTSKSTAAAIRKLKRMPSGFVTDSLTRLGLSGWTDGVYPANPKHRVVGPAVTVRYAPRRGTDSLATNIYEIIRSLRRGDVLIISTCNTDAYVMGENQANHAQMQGLAGMLTDGRARDFVELAALQMPVFCRGPAIRPHAGLEIAAVGAPIAFAGAQVNPGDIIVGDADGLAVIPASRLDDVLVEAEDIAEIEAAQEKAIKAKVPISKLNPLLAKKKKKAGS